MPKDISPFDNGEFLKKCLKNKNSDKWNKYLQDWSEKNKGKSMVISFERDELIPRGEKDFYDLTGFNFNNVTFQANEELEIAYCKIDNVDFSNTTFKFTSEDGHLNIHHNVINQDFYDIPLAKAIIDNNLIIYANLEDTNLTDAEFKRNDIRCLCLSDNYISDIKGWKYNLIKGDVYVNNSITPDSEILEETRSNLATNITPSNQDPIYQSVLKKRNNDTKRKESINLKKDVALETAKILLSTGIDQTNDCNQKDISNDIGNFINENKKFIPDKIKVIKQSYAGGNLNGSPTFFRVALPVGGAKSPEYFTDNLNLNPFLPNQLKFSGSMQLPLRVGNNSFLIPKLWDYENFTFPNCYRSFFSSGINYQFSGLRLGVSHSSAFNNYSPDSTVVGEFYFNEASEEFAGNLNEKNVRINKTRGNSATIVPEVAYSTNFGDYLFGIEAKYYHTYKDKNFSFEGSNGTYGSYTIHKGGGALCLRAYLGFPTFEHMHFGLILDGAFNMPNDITVNNNGNYVNFSPTNSFVPRIGVVLTANIREYAR